MASVCRTKGQISAYKPCSINYNPSARWLTQFAVSAQLPSFVLRLLIRTLLAGSKCAASQRALRKNEGAQTKKWYKLAVGSNNNRWQSVSLKLSVFLCHYSCQCLHNSYLPFSSGTTYFRVQVRLKNNILVQSVRGACLLTNV